MWPSSHLAKIHMMLIFFVFAQIIFTCTITLINAQADNKI